MSNIVNVLLSTGATIPLRPLAAKSGNIYHAVLKVKSDGSRFNPGPYGIKINPEVIGGTMPDSVTIEGNTFQGIAGTTVSGNPKRSFSGTVTLAGEARVLKMSISALPDGNYNIAGTLTRPGGSSSVRQAVTSL